MGVSRLFNVILPQSTRFEIKQKIASLESGDKASLYFLQNRSFLLANGNQWFRSVLNSSRFLVMGGNISHWAVWKILKPSYLARFYSFFLVNRNFVIRIPFFLILFFTQLILNYFNLVLMLLSRYNLTPRTKTQSVNNSEFTFDLLKIAAEKNWRVFVFTGSSESDKSTKALVEKLYPEIDFLWWDYELKSLSIQKTEEAKSCKNRKVNILQKLLDKLYPDKEELTFENLYEKHPELWGARDFVKKTKPNLVLVNSNSDDGKQEFFVHNLVNDKEIDFALAASLSDQKNFTKGFDLKQKIKTQLSKAKRNFEFLWLTTLQEFTQLITKSRPTAVNIITNQKDEYLLIKRRNYIPSNYGYSFVQGGIKKGEQPEETGIREAHEEVNLDIAKIRVLQIPIKTCKEIYPLSMKIFVLHLCKYSSNQDYINFFEYKGDEELKVNCYENIDYCWVEKKDVEKKLSIEKRGNWKVYN